MAALAPAGQRRTSRSPAFRSSAVDPLRSSARHATFLGIRLHPPTRTTQSLPPVPPETPSVDVARSPPVDSLPLLLSVLELSLVDFPFAEPEPTPSILEVVEPGTFVDIAVYVAVDPLRAFVVGKSAPEGVPVEESELSLDFFIEVSEPVEDRALAKVVDAIAMLQACLEGPLVAVLVGVIDLP